MAKFVIQNLQGHESALEFNRNGNANWLLSSDKGYLHFKSDWNGTKGNFEDVLVLSEATTGSATLKGSFTIGGSLVSSDVWSAHPIGGEADIGVAFDSGKYLYLWGNNSSKTRGLWDSNRGSVIAVTDNSVTFNGLANAAVCLQDKTNGTATYLDYGATAVTSASYLAAWSGYTLKAITPSSVRSVINALNKSGDTATGDLWVSNSDGARIGASFGSGKYLYFYGNTSTGGREIYDSNLGTVLSVSDSMADFNGRAASLKDAGTTYTLGMSWTGVAESPSWLCAWDTTSHSGYTATVKAISPANVRSLINAPSTSGTDASGTWSISVTGNAATASQLYVHDNSNSNSYWNVVTSSTRGGNAYAYSAGTFRFGQAATWSELFIGNTEGRAGWLALYSSSGAYSQLSTAATTDSYYYLPEAGGNLVTSDYNTGNSLTPVYVNGNGHITSGYSMLKSSNFNINNVYDTGFYIIQAGSNLPHGGGYGTLLQMAYRQHTGNAKTDYSTQIFMPAGDTTVAGAKNALYYRTSIASSWNSWKIAVHSSQSKYWGTTNPNDAGITGELGDIYFTY